MAPFPQSLTTTPFGRSSTGRFETCSCKPISGGLLPSSVQHRSLSPAFVTHPSALFFGFLETGALAMQRQVGVPSSLVLVIQGLTMVFVLSSFGRAGSERV